MPLPVARAFIAAMRQFPDVDFLWKTDTTEELPPNVYAMAYLPQVALLSAYIFGVRNNRQQQMSRSHHTWRHEQRSRGRIFRSASTRRSSYRRCGRSTRLEVVFSLTTRENWRAREPESTFTNKK